MHNQKLFSIQQPIIVKLFECVHKNFYFHNVTTMAITLTFSTLLTISRPSRYPNCALPSGLLCTRFRSENKAGTCSLFARITYEVKERERNCCCFFKKKKKKIKKDHCVRCFIFIRGDCKKRVDRSDLLRLRLLFIVHPNFLA